MSTRSESPISVDPVSLVSHMALTGGIRSVAFRPALLLQRVVNVMESSFGLGGT